MTHAEWVDDLRDAAEDMAALIDFDLPSKEQQAALDRLREVLDAEPLHVQTVRTCFCPTCGGEHVIASAKLAEGDKP